jgi:hypothetical protein
MRNSQIAVEGVAWAIQQSDELMSLYDITSSVSPSMKPFLIISLDFVRCIQQELPCTIKTNAATPQRGTST